MRIKPQWFDALFLLRPTLFFPAWTAFLAGYRRSESTLWEPLPCLIWLACAAGASFLLNQITDQREDRTNGKLLPLWGEAIPLRWLKLELGILVFGVLMGGIWVGWELSGWLLLFLLIAGVLYNLQPFRLKGRPILGVVACSAGGWIIYVMGTRAQELSLTEAGLSGLPYALAGAAASLLTHIPDLEGDRQARIRTFPLVYGIPATGRWAVCLVVGAFGVALLRADYVLGFAAAVALPFFIRFWRQGTEEAAQLAVKAAIFSLAVMVGTTWWPLLALMALYYPFARWYHRQRLGLDYPTFRSGPRVLQEPRPAPANPVLEASLSE